MDILDYTTTRGLFEGISPHFYYNSMLRECCFKKLFRVFSWKVSKTFYFKFSISSSFYILSDIISTAYSSAFMIDGLITILMCFCDYIFNLFHVLPARPAMGTLFFDSIALRGSYEKYTSAIVEGAYELDIIMSCLL